MLLAEENLMRCKISNYPIICHTAFVALSCWSSYRSGWT